MPTQLAKRGRPAQIKTAKTVKVTLELSGEIAARLDRQGKQDDLPRATIARMILREGLERREREALRAVGNTGATSTGTGTGTAPGTVETGAC